MPAASVAAPRTRKIHPAGREARALGLTWLVCLLSACVARAQAPAALPSIAVGPGCKGACSAPRLVEVDEQRIVALWHGDDAMVQAQSIDLVRNAPIGPPAELGKLVVKGPRQTPALAPVPVIGGDLALFGALRDGRITFTRGSTVAARRVPAKVVVPAVEPEVSSIAATVTPEGFAVVVLRRPSDASPSAREMRVELHQFGASGESLRPALSWNAAAGTSARIAQCDGTLYVAWSGPNGLVSHVVSSAGARSTELVHSYGRQVEYGTSPIVCVGSQGRILSAWFARAGTAVASKVSIARLDTRRPQPRWKELKLPGRPIVAAGSDSELVLASHEGKQLAVLLDTDTGGKLLDLDLGTETVGKRTLSLPEASGCMPLTRAQGVACVHERNRRDKQDCWVAEPLTFTRYGGSVEPAANAHPSPLYWAKAQLENPEAPSARELMLARQHLQCGEPGWAALREALTAFCTEQAKLSLDQQEQYLSAYCGSESTALEAQARSCVLPGGTCAGAPRQLPSVERVAYDKGEWVEFRHEHCAVWFTRDAGKWRVVDGECDGD